MSVGVEGGRRSDPTRGTCASLRTTNPAVLAQGGDSSLAAEQYRNVALQILERAELSSEGFVLTVTSAEPATGKSLVSLNLGLTLAHDTDKRVLLIEGDLRKPTLDGYLEVLPRVPGLWQVLNREAELERAVIPLWGTRLELLLAGGGGRVRNVIAQPVMSEGLRRLRSRYPIIIMDSPPLTLASGRSAATRADAILLVARAGRTRRLDLRRASALLPPERILGVVLNATTRAASDSYGLYNRYGYGRAAEAPERARRRLPRWLLWFLVAALLAAGATGFLWLSSRGHLPGVEGLSAAGAEVVSMAPDPGLAAATPGAG